VVLDLVVQAAEREVGQPARSRHLKELQRIAEVAYLLCFHGFDPLIGTPLSSRSSL
jgi:hypothetical protein